MWWYTTITITIKGQDEVAGNNPPVAVDDVNEIFEDAVHTIIFSTFNRIFREHESDMIRIRILRNEVKESDIWIPNVVRQRALVALYQNGRWHDVVLHFQDKLSLLPYSASTKISISTAFFNKTEPALRRCCHELANEPGFISTTSSVYRSFQWDCNWKR